MAVDRMKLAAAKAAAVFQNEPSEKLAVVRMLAVADFASTSDPAAKAVMMAIDDILAERAQS